MAEKPLPNSVLVGQGVDWAQKKIIEANSGKYTENVYQAFNDLVDVFLARRLQIAGQISAQGGVQELSELGRRNGILCKSGLFIPASDVLSVKVLDEEVDPPSSAPHGTRMTRVITAWFGGGGVNRDPWDTEKVDQEPMFRNGGLKLVFTPGYIPSSVGITENIVTSIDGIEGNQVHSEHFRLEAEAYRVKDQRNITNPVFDIEAIIKGVPVVMDEGLLLSFKVTSLFRQGDRLFRDWATYFEERGVLGTEIITNVDSINNMLRLNNLLRFVYNEVVGEIIIRSRSIDVPQRQISGQQVKKGNV